MPFPARDPLVLILVYILAVSAIFLFRPGIDVWFTGLFHDPAAGFAAGGSSALRALRRSQDGIIVIVVIAAIATLVLHACRAAIATSLSPRAALFAILGLVVGPGLVVNVFFKDYWGRPRPATIAGFGGDLPFVRAWQVSGYCSDNCSFVSGEASSALWLVALALLLPRPWRMPVTILVGIYALALSLNRVMSGRHFASDVLLSWGITALVLLILYRLIYGQMSDAGLGTALARIGRRWR